MCDKIKLCTEQFYPVLLNDLCIQRNHCNARYSPLNCKFSSDERRRSELLKWTDLVPKLPNTTLRPWWKITRYHPARPVLSNRDSLAYCNIYINIFQYIYLFLYFLQFHIYIHAGTTILPPRGFGLWAKTPPGATSSCIIKTFCKIISIYFVQLPLKKFHINQCVVLSRYVPAAGIELAWLFVPCLGDKYGSLGTGISNLVSTGGGSSRGLTITPWSLYCLRVRKFAIKGR